LVFNSCKSDFDTIAPYKEMVCVYAMLEHNSSNNYIRINRVFLGEGDAYAQAQQNDSANFAPGELTVSLEKYRDGSLTNTFALTEVDSAIPSGTFNSNQLLWRCSNQLANFPSENSYTIKYKLKIHSNKTGKDWSAETKLVKDPSIILSSLTNNSMNFTNLNYPVKFKWYNAQYGKVTNCTLKFYYQEFMTSDTTVYTDKMVEWNLGNKTVSDINTLTSEIEYSFMGEDFYRTVANLVPADGSIWGRKARGVIVQITSAGEEFQLYTEVNSPSNTIVQDKPLYTNIADGVGVFSSRSVKISKGTTGLYTLSPQSLEKLAGAAGYQSSPTCGLKFLDDQGAFGLGCQ
jgi:hypothetical protein